MKVGIGIITVETRVGRAGALANQLVEKGYGAKLGYGPVVNVDREWRGPWWNFRFTCELLFADGFTHACVLEDDVQLCSAFLTELGRVVEAVPTAPLSLFTARASIVREADKKGTKLLQRYDLDTAQGLVFPRFQFESLCRWIDAQEAEHPEWKFHGDMRIAAWSKARRWPIVHVVPSLVDHDVSLPSTLGHSGRTKSGWRVSPRFYDHALDPRAGELCDWGRPK